MDVDEGANTVTVTGIGAGVTPRAAQVHARHSGTTSRFILPVAALGDERVLVDGSTQLRARPFGPLIESLRDLGASIEELDEPGHLPVAVTGPLAGGRVRLPGHLSSQFLSGLLMAGPLMRQGLEVELTSPLVSVPYVEITTAVMAAFGVHVDEFTVRPGSYRATDYVIEPDASAASYFFGAAALTGAAVTIEGLHTGALQGDVAFVDVLERMGARVERSSDRLTVTGSTQLRGVEVDMADISDTAQTLAAVAVFADSPTRVRGIGFIRGKETNRIAAIVTELRRAGIDTIEHEDGFTVHPAQPTPTTFQTYADHRMAMSLSLLGLRASGIRITDPGCVGKTYPGFFTDLARLG